MAGRIHTGTPADITETVLRMGNARPARHRGYVPASRVAEALGLTPQQVLATMDAGEVQYRPSDCCLAITPRHALRLAKAAL